MDGLEMDLTLDMLSGDLYKEIAEAIGIENFVRLAEVVGGSTIYIPKPESVVRPVRDARIKEEFNGYNHVELAKRYNVTERWVRQLCGPGKLAGQMSLLDLLPAAGQDDSS